MKKRCFDFPFLDYGAEGQTQGFDLMVPRPEIMWQVEQNDKLPFKMCTGVTESKLGTEIDFMVFASYVEVRAWATYSDFQ